MLADATPPNRATDASAATAPPVRYVADNPRQWIGRPSVGSGECVPLVQQATGAPLVQQATGAPLVQQATGAPRSSQWRQGPPVQGDTGIYPGTAIATFDANGHYAGHAAIYLGQDAGGIQVVDQWNDRADHGGIIAQKAPGERYHPFIGTHHTRINLGVSYDVIR